MSNLHRLTSYAIVTMGATLMSAPAFAQVDQASTDVGASEEDDYTVTVTARRRSEQILDVPETITAIPSEILEEAGIRDLNDLGRTIPNIVLNRRADNEPNVVIRGIGSFGNVQGVGFYVDDVQNFFDSSARIVDLERIEILKGPQGTLYGGNSIGGAVRYITRRPSSYAEASMSVEAGGQDIFNVSGSANIPLSDNMFLRVSGYSAADNGYLFNPILSENTDSSKEGGVRVALRIQPSERTDINISGRINYLENGNNYHLVTSMDDYNRVSAVNESSYNKRRVWGVAIDISHDFGPVTLTSISSYSDRWSRALWGFDYGPLDLNLFSQPNPYHGKYASQELRLASNGDGALGWIVGGFYSSLRDRNTVLRGDVRLGVDFGPAFPGAPVPLIISDFFNQTTLETTHAAFANLTYEIGAFEIDAGARLHHVKFEGTERTGMASTSVEDTVVLPKGTISYETGGGVMFYTSVAQGYEPGRITLGTIFEPGFLAPYDPEKSTNYEVGLKGEAFDRQVQFEVAGFHISYKDRTFETAVRDAAGNVSEVIDNIGDARVWGLEGAITVRPSSRLTLSASGGYLDSKWKEATYFLASYDGNRTPFSPEYSATASADYTMPVSDSLDLSLRGDVSYVGSFYWDIPNVGRQEAYTLVGLRAAVAPNNGPWEIFGRVQNLFDAGYNTEFVHEFNGPGSHLAKRGQPRLFTAGLIYNF